jgi:GTP-binding protein HflX
VVIGNLPFLLTDTVGFIRKLPHSLVESFKSTLDEVREADLLLHIVDISHPAFEEQVEVARQTLAEIGCSDKPAIMVFNKIDAYTHVEKDAFDLTPSNQREPDAGRASEYLDGKGQFAGNLYLCQTKTKYRGNQEVAV